MKRVILAILTNNLLDFQEKLKKISGCQGNLEISGLTDWLQIDIIDIINRKFVKNVSPNLIRSRN